MLQIQCKMSRDATSVSNPLKRKLPRIIFALRRGLIEAVYLTLVKSCLLDYTAFVLKLALLTPYGTQYTDELHSLSYIKISLHVLYL